MLLRSCVPPRASCSNGFLLVTGVLCAPCCSMMRHRRWTRCSWLDRDSSSWRLLTPALASHPHHRALFVKIDLQLLSETTVKPREAFRELPRTADIYLVIRTLRVAPFVCTNFKLA